MDRIARLARVSVLRASGYSMLGIVLMMSAALHDPAASLRFGAAGLIALSATMGVYARFYHRRKRIEDTEVWIMLRPEERPSKAVARVLIVNAMKEELVEKALWCAWLALALLAVSAVVMAFSGGEAGALDLDPG